MKCGGEKQRLFGKYPRFVNEIEAMWNDKQGWQKRVANDAGGTTEQWDKEVKITSTFKATVISMEIEAMIEEEERLKEEDATQYVTDGPLGGLGILKSELEEYG